MTATIIRARVIHAMTIPFTVQIAATTATAAETALDTVIPQIDAYLHDIDARFSPFRSDSLVGRARRGDWSALLSDREFAEIYALCQQAKRLTDGAFDPMHAGEYDPTGLVKGWAVQRAYERFLQPLLRDAQHDTCKAAAIGGGGDIQAGVRSGTDDFAWRIGVDNPFGNHATALTPVTATEPNVPPHSSNREKPPDCPNVTGQATETPLASASRTPTLHTITLRNGAIATSGTSARGEHITRGDHSLAQATIVADQLIFADMWATTAISIGEDRLRALISRAGGFGRVDHVQAVLVSTDRSLAYLP